jgi:deoxyribonuclease-4
VRIGYHFAIESVIDDAAAAGATAAQVFLSDPQKWTAKEVAYPGGAAALKHDAHTAGLELFVHAPYVMNVVSLSNRTRIPSRNLLKSTVSGAAKIGAVGVVVHGGHVKDGEDPLEGFVNWRKAVDAVEPQAAILIENTAGGANAMARELEQIAILWQALSGSPHFGNVGFALDTCHAWAAGWDLRTAVADLKAITGRIDVVHLNNSRDKKGSGADRHAPLATGQIPPELLLEVAQQAQAPIIIETHGDPLTEITWVKERLK